MTDINKDFTSDPKNIQDLTTFTLLHDILHNLFSSLPVQTLLQQMQDKFQQMSDQIRSSQEEMGNRIDDLEKNIADLMTQAGVDDNRA